MTSMGCSYANLTVLGHGHDAVARALRGQAAFVTAPEHGATVVFPADEHDGAMDLGERLSADLACPVLGVAVADDDLLLVSLWAHGVLVHSSCSPDPRLVFDTDPEAMWEHAIRGLGVDPMALAPAPGTQ